MVLVLENDLYVLEEFKVRVGTISLKSNGIIYNIIKPNMEVGLCDAKEIINAFREISKGIRYPVLTKPGAYTIMDGNEIFKQAQALKEEAKNYIIAHAILIKSLPQRILLNFYMKCRRNSSSSPIMGFSIENEALNWLNKFQ